MADKNCNQGCFFFSLNYITFPLFPIFLHSRNLVERPDLEGFYWVGEKEMVFTWLYYIPKNLYVGKIWCILGSWMIKKESIEYVVHSSSCIWLCDPMNCSMPTLPVPHHLPELAQVHVHCTGDAIQPSHPLMPPSPSALNLSQRQGLFQWVDCIEYKYWK